MTSFGKGHVETDIDKLIFEFGIVFDKVHSASGEGDISGIEKLCLITSILRFLERQGLA